jgi:putative PIN family toxin of toxin-antitoxin system
MRFVIDTNLLVSGIISAGLPRQLLEAARTGDFELCTSEVLLAELQRVLGRDKFANRLAGQTPESIVSALRKLAIVVVPTEIPRVVLTDPDDDHVLAAALAGAAHLIASGDRRDLLPLASYQGIPIVTARQAWERLASRT